METVDINTSGDLICSGSVDNTIIIWRKGEVGNIYTNLRTLIGHHGDIHSCNFSDDGKLIASASGDKTIKIWKSSTGELMSTLKGHEHWVYAVRFLHSNRDRVVVSGGRDDKIILWNLKNKTNRLINAHNNSVTALAISQNNKFVVTGSSDKIIKIWEASPP